MYYLLLGLNFGPPAGGLAIPIMTLLFPSVNLGLEKLIPRIILVSFYFLASIPVAISGLVICSLSLITLHCIQVNLQVLGKRVKRAPKSFSFYHREKLLLVYRKVQVLIILCNQCFQKYIWTNFQFACSCIVISIMYCTIVFGAQLNNYLLSLMVLVMIISTIGLIAVLDYGSRPLMFSRRLLFVEKKWITCEWTKRYLKSCPVISLKVGMFHKMDRDRGPATLRFCLQRTFFLVVQSKICGLI